MLDALLKLFVEALATLFFGVCCLAVGATITHTAERIIPRTPGRVANALFYLDTASIAITVGWLLWRWMVSF